jgi:hypothetical protein
VDAYHAKHTTAVSSDDDIALYELHQKNRDDMKIPTRRVGLRKDRMQPELTEGSKFASQSDHVSPHQDLERSSHNDEVEIIPPDSTGPGRAVRVSPYQDLERSSHDDEVEIIPPDSTGPGRAVRVSP